MKALNSSILWQQMEEVDTICKNIFLSESYSKWNIVQPKVLHVVPKF